MSEDPEWDVDFRKHPHRYEIGRGERGVFKVEPYKSELLPLWGIADLQAAREGAEKLYERYREYRRDEEFVGMDMARKYLQMGWTRALRYAKYPGGQKYEDRDGERVERQPQKWYDEQKREIARIYKQYLDRVRDDDDYQRLKRRHRRRGESD